jgi:hypothetical protein
MEEEIPIEFKSWMIETFLKKAREINNELDPKDHEKISIIFFDKLSELIDNSNKIDNVEDDKYFDAFFSFFDCGVIAGSIVRYNDLLPTLSHLFNENEELQRKIYRLPKPDKYDLNYIG